ncbi:MAG: hypothetical protein OEV95_14060 [Gemmatimonadota bacterium]|nr:hypothetical protein [Gemmatimonadota bacterium]
MPSILDTGKAAVAKVAQEKPNAFTVGGYTDGRGVHGEARYDRKWSNGWGATAYLRAWWNDASVTPGHSQGAAAGFEITKR